MWQKDKKEGKNALNHKVFLSKEDAVTVSKEDAAKVDGNEVC